MACSTASTHGYPQGCVEQQVHDDSAGASGVALGQLGTPGISKDGEIDKDTAAISCKAASIQLDSVKSDLRRYLTNVVAKYLSNDGCRRVRLKTVHMQVLTIDAGLGVITTLGGSEVATLPVVAGESLHKVLTDTLDPKGLKLLRLLQESGEELQAEDSAALGEMQGQMTAEVQDRKLHVLSNRMAVEVVEKSAKRFSCAFADMPVKEQKEFLGILANAGLTDSQKQKKFRQGLYKDSNIFDSKDALLMRIKKLLKTEKTMPNVVDIADRLWKLGGKVWECIEPTSKSNSLEVRLDTDVDDAVPLLVDSKHVEDLTVASELPGAGKPRPLTFKLTESVESPAVFKREAALKRQEAMNVLRRFSEGNVELHTAVSGLVVACSATFLAGEWNVQYQFDGEKDKGRKLKQALKQRFKRRVAEWLYEDKQNQPSLADKLRAAIQNLIDQMKSATNQHVHPSSSSSISAAARPSRQACPFLDINALLPDPLVACLRKTQLEEYKMKNKWDQIAFSIELDANELDAVLEYSQDMSQILEFLLYVLKRCPRQPSQFLSIDTGTRLNGKKVIKSVRIRAHESQEAFPRRKGGEVSDSESWDGSASSDGDEDYDGRKVPQRTAEAEASYQAQLKSLLVQSGENIMR